MLKLLFALFLLLKLLRFDYRGKLQNGSNKSSVCYGNCLTHVAILIIIKKDITKGHFLIMEKISYKRECKELGFYT